MSDEKQQNNMHKSDNATIRERDPQMIEDVSTADDIDNSAFLSNNGVRPDTGTTWDSQIVPEQPANLTEDFGLAVDGGFLSGQKDKFEGDLGQHLHQEPGAGDRANEGLHNARDQETR